MFINLSASLTQVSIKLYQKQFANMQNYLQMVWIPEFKGTQ